jgi:hypothetical protein
MTWLLFLRKPKNKIELKTLNFFKLNPIKVLLKGYKGFGYKPNLDLIKKLFDYGL